MQSHPSAQLDMNGGRSFLKNETASGAVLTIAGLGTITVTGLLAWFLAGSVLMAAPGIVGFMGFLAAFTALGLLIFAVIARSR